MSALDVEIQFDADGQQQLQERADKLPRGLTPALVDRLGRQTSAAPMVITVSEIKLSL